MTVPFLAKPSGARMVAAMRSDPHAPIAAMIEIADRCNEVCVHCYQIQGQKGEMTTEQVERVIDELADLGVLFLTFSGGEPTLRSDFLQLVAHARSRGFAVKVFTNALTMTPALAQALSDLAVFEVQISLYSHRPEVHDWVTRVPGAFDRVVAGVRELVSRGVAVVLKTPLMSFNEDEYREYIEHAVGLGCSFQLDPVMNAREGGGRDPQAFRMSDEAYLRAHRDHALGKVGVEPPPVPLSRKPCGACSGNVHVEANGELRPCTLLEVPVGNALEDGVAAAWTDNPDARAIRHITWGDIHGCRDCDLRPWCFRCFANARAETGDALGPYEGACRGARLTYAASHPTPIELVGTEGRDPAVGPYRITAPGCLEAAPHRIGADDARLAREHPWTRTPRAESRPAWAEPGELVQIRRPGRRRPGLERVPGSTQEAGE